jgi:hypothetical protein
LSDKWTSPTLPLCALARLGVGFLFPKIKKRFTMSDEPQFVVALPRGNINNFHGEPLAIFDQSSFNKANLQFYYHVLMICGRKTANELERNLQNCFDYSVYLDVDENGRLCYYFELFAKNSNELLVIGKDFTAEAAFARLVEKSRKLNQNIV